jgi:hypothetical protein
VNERDGWGGKGGSSTRKNGRGKEDSWVKGVMRTDLKNDLMIEMMRRAKGDGHTLLAPLADFLFLGTSSSSCSSSTRSAKGS